MAKGIDINGNLRGKRGGIVYFRRGGEQISRVRVAPRNPRSAKQAVQRMVLATASKMASAFEPLVNHSWEGIAVGQKSTQHFRRLAMDSLRQAAAMSINGQADSPAAFFAIKGSPIVGALANLQISSGSLSMNAVTADDKALILSLSAALSSTAFTTQDAYAAELAKLGIMPGDQLTFVLSAQSGEIVATVSDGDSIIAQNNAQLVRYCRVTFVPELPDEFSGTLLSGTAFNPALIKASEGVLPSLTAAEGYITCSFASVLGDFNILQGGVIRSQKDESTGKFYYSRCNLVANAAELDDNDALGVYRSYMDGQVSVNVGANLYLRNAVASPFV